MDDLDQRLITLLRHNGRRSVSDLAHDLGVSRATVRSRMERLERSGDIVGYTVILRADAVSLPVVSAIHTTNGKWDLVVELGATSLSDLDAILRRIRLIPGVIASETNLLLATPRSTRARL